MAIADPSPTLQELGAYGPQGRSAWMDIDWSEHLRWVTLGDIHVNVVDVGPRDSTETPVVFVHGLSGCWQNWLENIPHFAADRRVIAMDLPGFGASPLAAGEISITGYARTLDRLLGELGIAAACVIGNSMGGFIAAELAIRSPQRVERLVLVSPVGIDVAASRSERALSVLRRTERALALATGAVAARADSISRRTRLRRAAMLMAAEHPELLPAPLMAEQIRSSAAPGFVGAVDALTSYDFEHRLGEIVCPTLIYWGRKDRLVPVRHAKAFNAAIPDSRCIVLPDTGHTAMLERPARFNADVSAFLAETPGDHIAES